MRKKNLFLENKSQRKPLPYVRKHELAYAALKPAYTSMSLLM